MYEQAAYKDISGEEHNRTEAEPEAEVLTSKYQEIAEKLNGNAGYAKLLAEANQTDVERKVEWDAYLATQKNRTSLFPEVDKTKGVAVDWPEDRLEAAKAAGMSTKTKGTANLHQTRSAQQSVSTLSQNLAPGEHVEAVKTFLLNKGGVLPMRAGEEATILKVNTTSGVDTIITTDGKQGLFPGSDLTQEQGGNRRAVTRQRASAEDMSVRKTPSNLHLPPQIRGNVVDAAVRDGDSTFAAKLAKERELSKVLRDDKQKGVNAPHTTMPAQEKSRKSHSSLVQKERAEREERAVAGAKAESVVSAAIRSADSRFEAAKKLELERSQAAHLQRQKQLEIVHARYSKTAVKKTVATTPETRASYKMGEPTARSTQSAVTSTRAEEDSPKVSTVVKAKGTEASAVDVAVAAAEKTFDAKLEKHEAKMGRAIHSETQTEAKTSAVTDTAEAVSPEIKAAVAAAEAVFDKKMAVVENKAGPHVADASSAKVARASTQVKLAMPIAAARGVSKKRAVEEKRSHNAVQLGLDTAEASYTEAMAREEARSLKTHTLKKQLKMKELKVQQATMTVRQLRDALARDEDQGKHALVAKQLAQQSNYISNGLDDEETFSAMAQKGEVAHTTQERLAKASLSMSASAAHDTAKGSSLAASSASAKSPKESATSSSSSSMREQGQERSLMAKALQEQAAASREERQWKAQQLRAKEMQDEEEAAVRSANTMYDRHMVPLKHVSQAYHTYENNLQREEDAYSQAESTLRTARTTAANYKKK